MRLGGSGTGVLVVALLIAVPACGADTPASSQPGADATPASSQPRADATPASSQPGADATAASTAAGNVATPAPSPAPDAIQANVAEALRFTAPLVGGGSFDGAALAGAPVVFWFWAPT